MRQEQFGTQESLLDRASRQEESPTRRTPACLLLAASLLLSGCGIGTQVGTHGSETTAITLAGQVHGGQQPVAGADISLYAAGSAGDGMGAVDLLPAGSVATNGNGQFTFGNYTCPTSATQVYLVARGGNPGLPAGTSNGSLVMMTALGDCGALTNSTYVSVNEITTVASTWALAQFMAPGANVGASATNATGLRNAFLTVNNLVTTATGAVPGSALPAGGLVETTKLITLADVLSTCINSDGSAACQPLFSAATAGGTMPSNTLDAALNIVRHPAQNVSAIWKITPAASPFQPTLTAAPNDWTMSVTFGNCNSGCGGLNLPGSLAIDSTGSVWVANYFGGVVSKFSVTGVPAAANGFPGVGLYESYGLTVDGQDSAWVANEQSVSAAHNSRSGSVSHFSSAGTELSGTGIIGGGIYYPQAVAATASGSIWVADYGDSTASLLASDGTLISGSSGYATSALPFTSAVAVDAAQNGWFAVQGGAARVTPLNVVTSFPCCHDPAGIALDASSRVWLADYSASSIVELSSSGAVLGQATLTGGLASPQGIAIDGAGFVWSTNYRGNTFTELDPSSLQPISPSTGFGRDTMLSEPFGIGIDASGNLWISNAGLGTLTQMVGLASPVKTPLLGLPVQP